MHAPLRGARAIRAFLCFAVAYLLSYALRSVNAVIAPPVVAELGLSNADLGMLSSAYFIAFACLQLPLGIWLDRYGARRTEAALLLVSALGAAIFATSHSLPGLWIGRALIGVGVSACLMAAFKAYRQWFAMAQQSQLGSAMLVAGTSGALMATVPVTMALPAIGWRGVFAIVAALLLLSAALVFFLLKEFEDEFGLSGHGADGAAAGGDGGDGGYRRVYRDPYFWRLAIIGLLSQASFMAVQSLWIGPWMITVMGKSEQQSGEILFLYNLILMLAYLALGLSINRLASKGWSVHRLIAAGLSGALLAEGAIVLAQGELAWALWLLLAPCVAVTALVQSHVGLGFPASLSGRANTAYNLLLFVGAFVIQWGVGIGIDSFKALGMSHGAAFRSALAVVVALQAIALAQFVMRRGQRPKSP
jgi:predicted MFS family arabinose efflux permease